MCGVAGHSAACHSAARLALLLALADRLVQHEAVSTGRRQAGPQ